MFIYLSLDTKMWGIYSREGLTSEDLLFYNGNSNNKKNTNFRPVLNRTTVIQYSRIIGRKAHSLCTMPKNI